MMFSWTSFYFFCACHGKRGMQYFDDYLEFWSSCGHRVRGISAYKF